MLASSARICFSLTPSSFSLFPSLFPVITSPSSPPLLLSIYASRCCPPLPSISPPVTWVTLAVEIKVIKDLPWPPPVGQLNTSPPVVEELESPSQTAQPSPGQTSCDQHHHGGCWCSHCPASYNPPPIRQSIDSSSICRLSTFISVLMYLSICLSLWFYYHEQHEWWRVCMHSLNQRYITGYKIHFIWLAANFTSNPPG